MPHGVPTPPPIRWLKGKPKAIGLYLIQYRSGDLAVAEVVLESYVEEQDRADGEEKYLDEKDMKYLALLIDGNSEELSRQDGEGYHIARHYGPLRYPPLKLPRY